MRNGKGNRDTTERQYPYVRAWGRYMGSGHDYINAQVNAARAAGAPADATYRVPGTAEWATAGQIRDAAERDQLHAAAQRIAGWRLPRPTAPARRCDALARRGTGQGICERLLDGHGQCDRASAHIDQAPDR